MGSLPCSVLGAVSARGAEVFSKNLAAAEIRKFFYPAQDHSIANSSVDGVMTCVARYALPSDRKYVRAC